MLALQFDRTKAQHSLAADPLLAVVPDNVIVPFPLFFRHIFEMLPADGYRQADACISIFEVEPGDGQGFGAAQRIGLG